MESIYTKIKDMLSAYYPVFYLNSFEYDRTKQKIEGIADLLRTDNKKVRIYTWNCVEGLMEKTPEGSLYKGEEYDEPEMTLKYIYKNENREIKDIFILEDLSNYIEEDKIKYYIRKIAEHAKFTNTHAIILSAVYKLPTKLEKYVTVLNIPLPDRTDMERTLAVVERQTKKNLSVEMRNKMVDAALGMTSMEADLAFCLAAVKDSLGENAPYTVSAEKEQIIRKSGILDFFPKNESLKDVGGMDVLKDWLFKRQIAYQKRARDWGLQDYLGRLNENIDYYLKEDNEQRKYNYHKEVRRCLKNIAMMTVRNVIDLKRNIDNTYKNEPNYRVKLSKLKNLDEKRKNIALLINRSEDIIDNTQPVFFRVAMDTQMRIVVNDVKLQLNDSYHNLIEIEKQIIHYLNLIAYQNRIFEKVRRLKYLRDQFLLEEKTDIRHVVSMRNPVWMEPQTNYRIKLSVDNLRTSAVALEIIRKIISKRKNRAKGPKNMADAIPQEYMKTEGEVLDQINLQEIYNAFSASSSHLFKFVMSYNYHKQLSTDDRILFFCQIASQYAEGLNFTDKYETSYDVEYPLIYSK